MLREIGSRAPWSVGDFERWAILRPGATMIVDTRGGNIGMPEPFLHLGDVGLVIERIGGGGRAQGMRANQKPQLPRIAPHQAIDAVGGDRPFELSGTIVANRPEQRAAVIEAVPGGVEVIVDQSIRAGMQWQIARLAALAGDFQMRHTFARMPEILHLQLAQLLAPQSVEQQRRQDGAVTLALDRVGLGCGATITVAAYRQLNWPNWASVE